MATGDLETLNYDTTADEAPVIGDASAVDSRGSWPRSFFSVWRGVASLAIAPFLAGSAASVAKAERPPSGSDFTKTGKNWVTFPHINSTMSRFAGRSMVARCFTQEGIKHTVNLGHGIGGFTSVVHNKEGRAVRPGNYIMLQPGVCEEIEQTVFHPELNGTSELWKDSIGAQFWLLGHEMGRTMGMQGWERNPGYAPECWGVAHDPEIMADLGMPRQQIEEILPYVYKAHRIFRAGAKLPGCKVEYLKT